MPIYPVICPKCGTKFNKELNDALLICEKCGSKTSMTDAVFHTYIYLMDMKYAEYKKSASGGSAKSGADDFVIEGGVLKAYKGNNSNVVIPTGVKKIGAGAFKGMMMDSVRIPDTVSMIDKDAFRDSALSEVNIPNSVTSIGSYAFSGCKLTSIEIPNSLTSIGKNAFSGLICSKVVIKNGVRAIGESAFSSCEINEIVIPNTVAEIGFWAFSYGKVNKIAIPNSVREIPNGMFYKAKVKQIIIPNSVVKIGSDAFEDCELEEITIPASVTEIGFRAFFSLMNNSTLKRIVFAPRTEVVRVDKDAFYGCKNLVEVDIADGLISSERDGKWLFPDSVIHKPLTKEDFDKLIESRKKQGVCLSCGGDISFFGKCNKCGKSIW